MMRMELIDNWSEKLLLTLGFIKLALIIAFFLSFSALSPSLAANQADSPDSLSCGGQNLIEPLERDDPQKIAAIRQQAGAVINSDSILWKIEHESHPASWLFGTMHMADPKISTLKPNAMSALEQSGTIVIESVETLDPALSANAMAKLVHLTRLNAPETLTSLIRPDLADELEAAVVARNIPLSVANQMRPWLIATAIALPVCEMQRKQQGAKVLDYVIANHAKQHQKQLLGLESVEEQFTAIASLPRKFHLAVLEETLEMGSSAADLITTMKYLYSREQIGMILPLMRAISPSTSDGDGSAGFQEILIERRNLVMAERMRPILKIGNAFIAIGALHLPGKTGLVELLRDAGYRVSSVD